MAVKPCKECGTQVSTKAKTCPQCGASHPAGGWTTGAKIGLALLLLWAVGQAIGSGSGSNSPRQIASMEVPAARAPEMSVTASALWRAYDANEVSADNQYKRRLLLVTGTVSSIDKDFLDHVVLHLNTPNQFETVMATLADAHAAPASRLSKGQQVSLLCEGKGRVMGSPVLGACEIR